MDGKCGGQFVAIRVACRCGQQFDAPDVMAGTLTPCPVCQSPIAIPRVPPTPPAASQPAPPIVVACPCGQLFAATLDMAGMESNCCRCGQRIVVPGPEYRPQ